MDNLLSEKEVAQRENLSWGYWMFTATNGNLQDKQILNKADQKTLTQPTKWSRLYSFLQNNLVGEMKLPINSQNIQKDSTCELMECSDISDLEETKLQRDEDYNSIVDDLVTNIAHVCNQEGPKMNKFKIPEEDITLTKAELNTLGETRVRDVMVKTWALLLSDYSKLRFCALFQKDDLLVRILCQDILLQWLSKDMPRNVELLSEILSVEGNTICRLLIAPLLGMEDSPVTEDLMNLEELMMHMTKNDWSTLLTELVVGLGELEKWQIPVFTVIVEHSEPSSDYLDLLIQLMSSSGPQFCQNRDFGSLLVAVAKKVPRESESSISLLKTICNSYKGSLKFKVLKILSE